MVSSIILALSLLGGAIARPTNDIHAVQSADACVTGNSVHIIAARGSTEPQGEGDLQAVSDLITAAVPGSDSIGVVYPADLIPYESSETAGVVNMTSMIIDYATKCPDSNIVLLGYSQGGQIVADVLGGSSYSNAPPIDQQYTQNLLAAVTFGDPSHVKAKTYNAGTSTKSGLFARKDTTALDAYADVLQFWCDKGDIFCDSGLSISTHTSEVEKNGPAGAQFVIDKANA